MPDQRPKSNRRRYLRVGIEGATLQVVPVGLTRRIPTSYMTPTRNVAVRVLDLGGGGFRVLSWAPLMKGDRVLLKLRLPQWRRELTARAVVKWTKELEQDGKPVYEVGAEFVDLAGEDRVRLMQLQEGGGTSV